MTGIISLATLICLTLADPNRQWYQNLKKKKKGERK